MIKTMGKDINDQIKKMDASIDVIFQQFTGGKKDNLTLEDFSSMITQGFNLKTNKIILKQLFQALDTDRKQSITLNEFK